MKEMKGRIDCINKKKRKKKYVEEKRNYNIKYWKKEKLEFRLKDFKGEKI